MAEGDSIGKIQESLEGLYPRFSEEEYRRRHEKIRRAMEGASLRCLLIYGAAKEGRQQNLRYVSNWFDAFQAYVIFPLREEPTLFCGLFPHFPCAKAVSVLEDTRWGGPNLLETVVSHLKRLGMERAEIGIVGLESFTANSIPADHAEFFKAKLPSARFQLVTELLEEIRAVKSEEEVEWVERGAAFTDRAMEALVEAARPGVTEGELYGEVAAAAYRTGGTFSFANLGSTSMANPRMPFPWPVPSSRVLQPGDIILDEVSVSYGGYSGQICRPIALGEPTQDYQDLFDIAYQVYTRIAAALKPGNSEEDVWQAASPIVEAGLKIQAALVHGWTEKVENPRVGLPHAPQWPLRGIRFRAGETLMIEPNPCTPDLLKGTFLGGLHLVTPDGARSLQKYPVEFVVKPF